MKLVSELLSETAVRLGDSTNAIWTAAELLRYVNDAQSILCHETRCYWKQKYLNDQAGEGEAKLPTDFITIDRATWNALPLDIHSIYGLREMDKLYRTLEGEPLALGMDVGKLQKFRVPSVSITSTDPDSHAPITDEVRNTRVEYYATLPTLTSTSIVDLPESYAKYMRWYVLWHAYERDGPGQSPELAKHYQERWAVGLERIEAVKSRVQSARLRSIGGEGKPKRVIARPVYPASYGRIVRG